MGTLENIQNVIQKHIDDKNFSDAIVAFEEAISDSASNNDLNLSMLYYEYGFLLFDLGEYEFAVQKLVIAYELGYGRVEILEFFKRCFIEPNREEFEQAYNSQISMIKEHIFYEYIPAFDELPIDFIPISENKYYLFDKNTASFCNSINLSLDFYSDISPLTLTSEFSDATITGEWNISKIQPYIISSMDRKLYLLPDEPLKLLSFFKIPDIANQYLGHLMLFDSGRSLQKYLHENTSVYIPRIQYGNEGSLSDEVKVIFQQEHEFRLTKEGRNIEKLLLSLCIPTWNRGQRALENVLSLLELKYDAEIEIVISNNGSHFYTDEYRKISELSDARIVYSAFETNQGFAANVAQVVSLSRAPFSLLISDEDSLIVGSLEHYFMLLKNYPDLAILRSGTVIQYPRLKNCYARKGQEAFQEFFLMGNYIAGCIYNTRIFRQLDIELINNMFADNVSYNALGSYPHLWWDAMLTFMGDFCRDSTPLIQEGDSELESQIKLQGNFDTFFDQTLEGLSTYAQTQGRIAQHLGFVALINILPFKTLVDKLEGYSLLCAKTLTLFSINKKLYLKAGYDYDEICERFLKCLIDGMDLIEPKFDPSVQMAMQKLCYKLADRLQRE